MPVLCCPFLRRKLTFAGLCWILEHTCPRMGNAGGKHKSTWGGSAALVRVDQMVMHGFMSGQERPKRGIYVREGENGVNFLVLLIGSRIMFFLAANGFCSSEKEQEFAFRIPLRDVKVEQISDWYFVYVHWDFFIMKIYELQARSWICSVFSFSSFFFFFGCSPSCLAFCTSLN